MTASSITTTQQTTASSSSSSSSSPSPSRCDADTFRLRNKFLSKLGVESKDGKVGKPSFSPRSVSLLEKARIQSEPLKGIDDDSNVENGGFSQSSIWNLGAIFQLSTASNRTATSDSDTESVSTESVNNRTITFNEEVSVCLIPKRQEYSKRIRGHLWQSPEELVSNVRRNTVEFAAEGWDWRRSMEDDEMYRCLATNELIHPVHVEGHGSS